jgi:hypothetical protein
MGLRSILDDGEPRGTGYFLNCIHISRLTVKMDNDHGGSPLRNRAFDIGRVHQ